MLGKSLNNNNTNDDVSVLAHGSSLHNRQNLISEKEAVD